MRTLVKRAKRPDVYFDNNGTTIDFSRCTTAYTPDNANMLNGQPKMIRDFANFSPWTDNNIFDVRDLGLKLYQIKFPIEVIVACSPQLVNQQGLSPIQIKISSQLNVDSKCITQSAWHEIYLGQMLSIGQFATKFDKRNFDAKVGGQSWGDDFNYLSISATRQGSYSTITGVTKASPARATCSNSFTEGQIITVGSVGGMTQINNKKYKVANRDTNGFDLHNEDDSPVDSTGYSTFSGNGYAFTNLATQYSFYPPTFGRTEKIKAFCLRADDWEASHGDMWDYAKTKGVPITFCLTPGADNSALWATYQRIKSEADNTYNAMWGKQMASFINHGTDVNSDNNFVSTLTTAAATLANKGLGTDAYRHLANVNGVPTTDQTKISALKAMGMLTNSTIRKHINYASTFWAYPDAFYNLYCVAQGANPAGTNHTFAEIATNIASVIAKGGGMVEALVHKTATTGDGLLTVATAEFQRMVDYVAANKDIECLTIPDWYSRLTTGQPVAY